MCVIQAECLITSDMSSQLQHAQRGRGEGRKFIFLSQVFTARKQSSHFSSSFGVGVRAHVSVGEWWWCGSYRSKAYVF